MKILFLDHEHRVGGAELMLLRFLRQCDHGRIQGELVVPREGPFPEMARESGITVHVVPLGRGLESYSRGGALPGAEKFGALIGTVRSLRSFLRSMPSDLVVSNTMKAHVYGTLATFGNGIPYAWRLHDIIDRREFSLPQRLMMRGCARFGPVSIAGVSAAVCAPLWEKGISREKARVIHNGVEVPEGSERGQVESFRREHSLGNEVVTLVGRLMPAKGHELFLRAAQKVVRDHPGVQFLIVGDEFGSEGFQERLRGLVAEYGLSERVRFLGFQQDLSQVYGCSAVVVVPSITPESLPTVILEAMAHGVTIAASRIGGAPEVIDDGVNGRLFRAGDAEDCARVVR